VMAIDAVESGPKVAGTEKLCKVMECLEGDGN
jgi:hypothetical protein